MFDKKAYPENCLRENAGKCPDIFIIRCARAGHGS